MTDRRTQLEHATMVVDVPSDLCSGPVRLSFEKTVRPDSEEQLVPFYHFGILDRAGANVGHINFRVGDTRHVTLCAGHIGFEIKPDHQGYSYSLHACQALAPFVRRHYERVILTADPGNAPSIRIIERLGAAFLDEVDVPSNDPAYAAGCRRKKRYVWVP
jgi:tagatose 1,6-diphosphate aldolase